jgi:uncharacterized membrane protein YesL
MTSVPRDFGSGPLSQISAFVYTLLVVELMLIVASLPGLVPLFFVVPDLTSIPLVAACAIPFGPALSAAVYALHHRSQDLTELAPMRQFWRGYRLNWRAVLPVWLIGVVWLSIIGITLANFWASGLPTWWAVLLGLIGVLAALWLANAIVITSLFDFRTVDAIRLAWEMIPRRPVGTLGILGVLFAAGVLAYATTEILVGLLGSVFLVALLGTSRPMIALITAEYTE